MAEKSMWVRIGADISEFKSGLQKVQGYIEEHQAQFKRIGQTMTVVGAGMTAFFTKAVKSAAEQEVAEQKLINALRNVQGATEDGAKSLIKQATALQRLTGYGDEEIINAQAMLATFQLTDAQIAQITPRLLDMAAATEKSTGAKADLQAIAIALGKGFTGTAGSLTRYGVVLSEEAKKSGDFGLILESLDKNFKGAAETVGQTFTGQLRIMGTQIGDALEVIGGKLIPVLTPLVQKIAEVAAKIADWMGKNEGLMKVLVPVAAAIGALMAVCGPILIMLPALSAAFAALTGPVGLVIAVIAGLVAVGTLVVANWDKIKVFLANCWNAIKAVAVSVWSAIKEFFISVFEIIKTIFTTAFEGYKTIIMTYLNIWKTIITTGISAVVGIFGWLKDNVLIYIQNLVTGVVEKFLGLFSQIGEIVMGIKDKVVGAFKSVWHSVVGGSIVPMMVTQILEQFSLLRAGIGSQMQAVEEGTKQSFFRISEYAQAMQSTCSSAGKSLAENLRTSARSVIDTLRRQAIGYIIAKVMAALPFPLNLAAVGAAIAVVNTLFGAIKLAEGGIITRPTLAVVGERGPEAVIPLNQYGRAIGAGAGGVNMTVNFYGDINNAGDLDEISSRLADKLNQVIKGGRL